MFSNGVSLDIQMTLKGGPMPSSRSLTQEELSGIASSAFFHNALGLFTLLVFWLSTMAFHFVLLMGARERMRITA